MHPRKGVQSLEWLKLQAKIFALFVPFCGYSFSLRSLRSFAAIPVFFLSFRLCGFA
jgi:hypothetical protein